ncbi:STAS domain-containing protein [Amycolatopsis sp. NPDC051045]|uniref:STAS domain-containing protein n=1 Tax=Amycolatopsis sp. NPDC051045 TaxID=3156922 RepID=UPI00341267CD
MLAITVKTIRDIGVVVVEGDADHGVRKTLRETVAAALARGPRALVVDLTEVRFFGSAGLSVLAWLHQAAGAAGIEVTLVATRRSVLRPMSVTRIDDLFGIHSTLAQAVEHHGGSPPANTVEPGGGRLS